MLINFIYYLTGFELVEAFYSNIEDCTSNEMVRTSGDIKKFILEENGVYICGICFKRYRYKRGLKRHLLFICNKPPQFKCPICFKKCSLKHNLKSHVIFCHGPQYWSQFSDADFR